MGAFKLGKMTFGSLFKKPETVMYPLESKLQPAGLKGHIVIDVDRCILCGMCDRSCTTNCIKVDKPGRTWEINPYQCVQCGYCVSVCPKDCLFMDPNYWAAATQIGIERFEVPEQVKGSGKVASSNMQVVESDSAKSTADASSQAVGHSITPMAAHVEPASEMPTRKDAQLERLIELMEEDSAKKVLAALH